MNKSNYLRALMQKDLSAIRRALLNERLLKRASGAWPAITPEGVDGNPSGEEQRSADGGAFPFPTPDAAGSDAVYPGPFRDEPEGFCSNPTERAKGKAGRIA